MFYSEKIDNIITLNPLTCSPQVKGLFVHFYYKSYPQGGKLEVFIQLVILGIVVSKFLLDHRAIIWSNKALFSS